MNGSITRFVAPTESSTRLAILLNAPQGRIAVPYFPGDTEEKLLHRFDVRVKKWHWQVQAIMNVRFLERLEAFRKHGIEALDRLADPVEFED